MMSFLLSHFVSNPNDELFEDFLFKPTLKVIGFTAQIFHSHLGYTKDIIVFWEMKSDVK